MFLALWLACAAPPAAPPAVVSSPAPASAPATEAGAEVYVPIYSSVYIREGDQTFNLTVTLSIRNTDRERPLTIVLADLHDRDGQRVHAYLDAPTVLPPLGTMDVVVAESDTRAGVGGSFLVDWRADGPVSDPIVEAVMIGSGHQQGISLLGPGRTVRRHGAGADAAR